MRMTDRGLLALARHEGIVPGPYRDIVNTWTFGIGHTAAAGLPDPAQLPRGMPADLDAALRDVFRLFRTDVARYERDVERAVKVPLAPHEFDALVSFHYNTGGIATAALTKHLNKGDRRAAAIAFMGWLKPESIRSRREAEQVLFRDGIYPSGTIPVWAVDHNGLVDFRRTVRRLTTAEALAFLREPVSAPASVPHVSAAPSPASPTRGMFARLLAFLSTLTGGRRT